MQKSIREPVEFSGVGLHGGMRTRMRIVPAPADTGIRFHRTDLDEIILARWDMVTPSRLCTRIENSRGASVSTIEHIMAALAAMDIDNALVEIDRDEVPIMDGSSIAFLEGMISRGTHTTTAPRSSLRIMRDVEYREGDAFARLVPFDGRRIEFHIDFQDRAIGRQSFSVDLDLASFTRDLADCRTFCRASDVEIMKRNGLALGGTLENAVVVDGDLILTPGGLRRKDEPVRHKILDAVGDLALAGHPIIGRYIGYKAGHAMTNKLLRALFADERNWEVEPVGGSAAGRIAA